jgi:hypothetical protein
MERNVDLKIKGNIINLAKSYPAQSLTGVLDEIPRISGTAMHVAVWKINLSNLLHLAANYAKTQYRMQ